MNKENLDYYVATTLFDLEEILAKEIEELGIEELEIANRAVYFKGSQKDFYKATYSLRTAMRIFKPIHKFKAFDKFRLYKKTKAINWEDYLSIDQTFAIDFTVNSEYFRHSKYASLVVKDAIADYFRDKYDRRPSVDIENPDVQIHVYIEKQYVTISLDGCGPSLHKRGLRLKTVKAPINEVLAAGILKIIGWNGERPLIDPMCGSGTFLHEALMLARKIPAQHYRENFALMNWPDFNKSDFESVRKEADEQIIELNTELTGVELDEFRLEAAIDNSKRDLIEGQIKWIHGDFFNTKVNFENGVMVMNPPYGERIKNDDMLEFYSKIGDQMKSEYQGSESWIISSNIPAMKRIGLRPSSKIKLFNGPLECRLMKFELYSGSKKKRKE